MKQYLILLCFALLACICTMQAEIYSGYCGDQVNGSVTNVRWSLNTEDSTLTITGSGRMLLSPWQSYKSFIKYLVFNGDITYIDRASFYGDSALVSAKLPTKNTRIGESAFENCVSLKKLSFTSNYIDTKAFYQCTSLDKITIMSVDPYIGSYAFAGCPAIVQGPTALCTNIASTAFTGVLNIENCGGTTDSTRWGALCINGYEEDSIIYQNNKKTHIAACRRDTKGERVLPQSVKTIGKDAFSGCTDLTSIILPSGIQIIKSQAFKNCTGLTSFIFPSSLTHIDATAFKGCENLKVVTWDAFRIKRAIGVLPQITSITFGEHINTITPGICAEMVNLKSVIIPNHVIGIGNKAFYGCSSLDSVLIPNSVLNIGDSVYGKCTGLTDIVISEGVTNLGNSVFLNCNSLQTISLPHSVQSIGNFAFERCSGLTSMVIPINVTNVGNNIFKGCSNLKNIVWQPENSSSFTESPFNGISNQIESFQFGDDVLYIPAYLCSGMTKLSSIVLPASINTIDTCTFLGCTSLSSITIPDGVTSIKYAAFSGCTSLTNIHIPDNITSIEGSVFAHCKKLETIHLPKRLISIGPLAFKGDSALSSLTLPNSLTSIGKSAFMDCESLYSLKIPDKVTKLEDSTFSGCSLLNNVIIGKKVASLGEKVFEKCYNIDALTCLPTNPPSTKPNSVPSWSKLVVYVPAGSVSLYPRYSNQHWSSCREIRALPQAENVDVTGVTATAISDDSVSITWLHVLNAETYIVEVVLEGYSTITLYFTNNGIQYNTQYSWNDLYYAPVHERVSRRTQTELLTSASGWKFIIGDLIPEETYAYKITAINTDGDTISTQSGSFRMVVQYQISFINYDGTELQSGMVDKGVLPVYSGEIPTRPNDEQYTYTFKGWYPEVVAVTGPATYMAKFEAVEIPGTTDLKDVGSKNVIVQKFTKEGQIFILRGDKTYTITGAEVK